jgi:predicted DCC family thiol-disulfide oxidoreductase YuxK
VFERRPAEARPSSGLPERIFYDGTCGLCHGFVRFVLKRGRRGRAFRFAPLQGTTFRSEVSEHRRSGLPDSIVVLTADGRLLARSAGVIHVLEEMGGFWRVLARLIRPIPAGLRDAVYDLVARLRHRIFRRPPQACPIVPSHQRNLFDP